jgi:DNA repair protein RecO (recombination protein O)
VQTIIFVEIGWLIMVTTKSNIFSAIKYGDTSLIVKAFTASDGIKSYLLMRGVSSRKRKIKDGPFSNYTHSN